MCLDELSKLNYPKMKLIDLSEFETEKLLDVKATRSHIEYIWTLSPFAPQFVFKSDEHIKRVTYIDAAMYFNKSPRPIFREFEDSKKAVLISARRSIFLSILVSR